MPSRWTGKECMMEKKLLMIVNPRAGRNKSHGPLFDAAAIFSEAGYLLRIHRTTAPGDATETVAREGSQYDLVVASGGDTFPRAAPTTLPPASTSPMTPQRRQR